MSRPLSSNEIIAATLAGNDPAKVYEGAVDNVTPDGQDANEPVSADDPAAAGYPEETSDPYMPDFLREALGEQEEQQSDSEEDDSEKSENTEEEEGSDEEASTTEELYVKGPNGKRRKVVADYNDRNKIKQAYLKAAGLPKAFAERDEYKQQLESYKQETQEKVEGWDSLESAYAKEGFKGLVNFIEGDEGAYDRWLNEQINIKQQWDNMSPAQKEAYEAQQAAQRKDSELEQIRQEMQQLKESVTKEKEEADAASLTNTVTGAFDKYRFAGSLGDSALETKLDRMLWATARENLAEYPDDAPITKDMAIREFRDVAKVLKSTIAKQGRKQATKIVDKKKKEAAQTLQKMAKNNIPNDDLKKDMQDRLKRGDIKGILGNAGAFSRLLGR